MREILFRGKRVGDGEWVEGAFLSDRDCAFYICPAVSDITYGDNGNRRRIGCWYKVDPSTVGQYTGLNDKNGKRIFEGDVVEGHCHSAWSHDLQRCEVAYGRDGFEARHHVNCGEDGWRYYTYRVLFSKDVVVIGNIHDNPELLKGGEENY